MRANPNQTFTDKDPVFALSGRTAVFYLPTRDLEAAHNARQVINDLIQPGEDDSLFVQVPGGHAYFAVVRYTTHVDKINTALANVAEHYGFEHPVRWLSGVEHEAVALQGALQ